MNTPQSFSDVEMQLRLDLAADNEVKLDRARKALENMRIVIETYTCQPSMHAGTLRALDSMAEEALKRTI